MVLMAHPAKDSSSPWWYGMLMQEGKSGWFPNNYVEEIKREWRGHTLSKIDRLLTN